MPGGSATSTSPVTALQTSCGPLEFAVMDIKSALASVVVSSDCDEQLLSVSEPRAVGGDLDASGAPGGGGGEGAAIGGG
eukprot:6203253-Pleurochrysis_carterae.AAC.6